MALVQSGEGGASEQEGGGAGSQGGATTEM